MIKKAREFLSGNLTEAPFAKVLFPVYVACRALEKHQISHIETDTENMLKDIMEKSKKYIRRTYGYTFHDKYTLCNL